MARGDIIGFLIRPVYDRARESGKVFIVFQVQTSSYAAKKKSDLFVTTALMRDIIEYYGLKQGTVVGTMEPSVNRTTKIVSLNSVFPFDAWGTVRDKFMQKGIGELIEKQIEKKLKKVFRGYAIQSSNHPGGSRKEQLEKRGRQIGVPIPIAEAEELTRKQILAHFRRHKPFIVAVHKAQKTRYETAKHMRKAL